MAARQLSGIRHVHLVFYAVIILMTLLAIALVFDAFTIHHFYSKTGTIVHIVGTSISPQTRQKICGVNPNARCFSPTPSSLVIANESVVYHLEPYDFTPQLPDAYFTGGIIACKATIWYIRPLFLAPDPVILAIRIISGPHARPGMYVTKAYTHPAPTPDIGDLTAAILLFGLVGWLIWYVRRHYPRWHPEKLKAPTNLLSEPAQAKVPLLVAPRGSTAHTHATVRRTVSKKKQHKRK